MSDKTHFSKLCEDAWLSHRVSAGMMYKTRPDEDDGKRQLVPLGREYIQSRANPQSLVFAAIPGRTVIGPVLRVPIVKILGQPGLEIAIPPHNHETTTHVIISRGTNRFVDEVHDHKVEFRHSTELLSALQKSEGRESCVEESNNCNMETCVHHVTSRYGNKESRANNLSSLPNHSSMFKKNIIPTNERKWVVIPANPSYGGPLSIQVSKMVSRMVRHYDQEEREPDGSHLWDTVRPVLLKSFGRHGVEKFSERFWIQLIQEGSSEKRVEYCGSQKIVCVTVEQFKDTPVVLPILPGLMGYKSILYNCKDSIFHRGCSWSVRSILEAD